MNRYDALNAALTVPAVAALGYAFFFLNGNPYAYLPIYPVHGWTVFAALLAYLFATAQLKFLPIPVRQLYAAGLVVTGTSLYDSIYAVAAALTGHPASIFPLLGLVVGVGILVWIFFVDLLRREDGAAELRFCVGGE